LAPDEPDAPDPESEDPDPDPADPDPEPDDGSLAPDLAESAEPDSLFAAAGSLSFFAPSAEDPLRLSVR
jgi:hypothetical protein